MNICTVGCSGGEGKRVEGLGPRMRGEGQGGEGPGGRGRRVEGLGGVEERVERLGLHMQVERQRVEGLLGHGLVGSPLPLYLPLVSTSSLQSWYRFSGQRPAP